MKTVLFSHDSRTSIDGPGRSDKGCDSNGKIIVKQGKVVNELAEWLECDQRPLLCT